MRDSPSTTGKENKMKVKQLINKIKNSQKNIAAEANALRMGEFDCDFWGLIYRCATEVKNESWEVRKAVFEALYWYDADIYYWEEEAMYRNFCQTNEERFELRQIVYDDTDY